MKVDQGSFPIIVLLSGGIDSAACVRFYQTQGFSVEALFIDYGQTSRAGEWQAAQQIASRLRVRLEKLQIDGMPFMSGKIVGRNAALIILALMWVRHSSTLIAIGIHAGTSYEDCSPQFLESMQELADLYTGGRIMIVAPFLTWSKQRVWEFALAHDVPVDHSFSCERGVGGPCGSCPSCREVEELHAGTKVTTSAHGDG